VPKHSFVQDADGALIWSEAQFRDHTTRDDWHLEYRPLGDDFLWMVYCNGPLGWKNTGQRHLRNWEVAY
jgi:hypothetical protein